VLFRAQLRQNIGASQLYGTVPLDGAKKNWFSSLSLLMNKCSGEIRRARERRNPGRRPRKHFQKALSAYWA
jgi:hypothetical protein